MEGGGRRGGRRNERKDAGKFASDIPQVLSACHLHKSAFIPVKVNVVSKE